MTEVAPYRRKDLSLEEFIHWANKIAESRDQDYSNIYTGPPIRLDEATARRYWETKKFSPADAHRAYWREVTKPYFRRWDRRERMKKRLREALIAVLYCGFAGSTIVMFFNALMTMGGWGVVAFLFMAFGLLFTVLGTQKEHDAKKRRRLLDIAYAGDRAQMQPIIEAIRKEFK